MFSKLFIVVIIEILAVALAAMFSLEWVRDNGWWIIPTCMVSLILLFLYENWKLKNTKSDKPKKLPTMKLGEVLKHIKHSQKKSLRLKSQQYEDVFTELKNNLSEGNLISKGELKGEKMLRKIEPEEWQKLFVPLDVTIERGTNFAMNRETSIQYIDIRFYEDEVFNIWPKRKNLLNYFA